MPPTTGTSKPQGIEARMLRRIPNSYDSAPVILDLLADGRELWNTELQTLVADHFGLTKAERKWIRPGQEDRNRPYVSNETAWALSRLKNPLGFITRPPSKMLYSITPTGVQAQRRGVLLAEAEEKGVRTGKRVIHATRNEQRPYANEPDSSSAAGRADGPSTAERSALRPLTTSYVAVSEVVRPARDPFEYDPDELDQQTLEHAKLQNMLAAKARASGFHVFQPGPGDPVKFDLAWGRGGSRAVVEIKTLSTTLSEAKQLRLAIGQVLDYRHQLNEAEADVRAVIVVDRKPRGRHWVQLCADHDIALAWPSTVKALFAA
jgi:hypothetical protein